MKIRSPLLRSLLLALAIIAAVVIYAYGFEVTKVRLDETRDPHRQLQLTRILRALAQPDIFAYHKEEFVVRLPVYTPCPENDAGPAPVPESGPYLVMTPSCADPGAVVRLEGFGFEPNTEGPVSFIPPSGVTLRLATVRTDSSGNFSVEARLPKRPDTVEQEIRATTRRNVGLPYFSRNALDTWDKIIETVFLALLATTFGVLIAIPISFIAARNLMTPITSPLTSVALSLILLPVGLAAGWLAALEIQRLSSLLTGSIWLNLLGLIFFPVIMVYAFRWALPPVETQTSSRKLRAARTVVLFITGVLAILVLYLLSALTMRIGGFLAPYLAGMDFLAKFIATLGDLLQFIIPVVTAVAGAGILGGIAGRLGQTIVERSSTSADRILNLILGALAGAILFALIGAGINWLYQINQLLYTLTLPAIAGALLGLILAAALSRNAVLPIGFVIYTVTRTILNGLRSIESLVMVIIFAVWVGIGPFAGVLALALHTIASNAKLYSEQVEGIMDGPLEAITATGANRLQTIIYAVIPQIIPPYISYTMYRWDINVRMSTIIGFAGGGGIGFLLQQNINLLNYRSASAQMLAIAVVVATMDYISSKLRERVN